MCRLTPLLLALVAAAPVWAQTHLADGPGVYVSVRDVQVRVSNGTLNGAGVSGEIGRRFASGLDLGLVGSVGRYGLDEASTVEGASWSLGATAGLTRPAPLGTFARLEALASVADVESTFPRDGSPESLAYTQVGAGVEALLGKTVPVVGSVAVQPTVGAFANATRVTSLDVSDGLDTGSYRRGFGEVGLAFELPVRFRVLGTDAAVVPEGRLSVLNPYGLVSPRTGMTFRLNF